MSGKIKSEKRSTANPTSALTVDVNEKILRSCHELYTAKETGEVRESRDLFTKVEVTLENT